MERKRLKSESEPPKNNGARYLKPEDDNVRTFTTGCTLLDCCIGGGIAHGRIFNVVGDNSTGKTGVAIEASANVARLYLKARIRYNEPEAAFDKGYAGNQGMPLDRVEFVSETLPNGKRRKEPETIDTVEQLFDDLEKFCESVDMPKDGELGGLYVVDSLDALSTADEMDAALDKASYGTAKAKQMSQLFRRLVRRLEEKKITLIIISQVRDKIGVMFGDKHTRAGGRALNFYATQIIWLHHIGNIIKTKNGVKREVGAMVRAKCKKNKVAARGREVEFPIMNYYGIDDVTAAVEWFEEVGREDQIVEAFKDAGLKPPTVEKKKKGDDADKDGPKKASPYMKTVNGLSDEDFRVFRRKLNKRVRSTWAEIEETFAPTRKKY